MPAPIATSRAPKPADRTFAPVVSATSPIHGRVTRPGVKVRPTPAPIRPAATSEAIVRAFMPRNLKGSGPFRSGGDDRMIDRAPVFVGSVTLATGVALVAAPGVLTRRWGSRATTPPCGRSGWPTSCWCPACCAGTPRWPWMVGRAALNLAMAAYLMGAAKQSSSPGIANAGAGALLGLTVVDGATGLALRASA